MPKLHPVTVRMRDASIQAADDLLNAGRVTSIAEAARLVWARSRQRNTQTGFTAGTEKKFVYQFWTWYRKRRQKPTKPKLTDELSKWLADDYED